VKVGFAAAVAAGLTATTLAQRAVGGDLLERYASTNLDNLAARPVRSLLLSAVVLERGQWWLQTPSALAALGGLEHLAGTRRVAGVALAGHVLPTLATQAAVGLGIAAHRLPAAARQQVDVGASYMIAAAVGALVRRLPSPADRVVAGLLALAAAAELGVAREVVAGGHGLAFAVGYVAG
jgi:hypothetical protein